jgi:kumamolisin
VSLSWSLSADEQRSSSASGGSLKSAHQLLEDAFKEAMLLGTTVCCASGDRGSNGDDSSGRTLQVDYPAASAYVLACGGTTLAANNGRPSSEKVWNARTSGIHFASGGGLQVGARGAGAPAWQVQALEAWAGKTRDRHALLTSITRGVPDVACNADFNTGCQLIVAGVAARAGGTSASAPIWAALVARLNSALRKKTNKRIGFANPAFYSSASAFNNIGTGYNNMSDPTGPYRAVRGTWDPCTGLGTPRGDALLAALEQLHRSASPSKGRVSHK